MAIITLSREMGSLGKDIARALEKELNLNYLDKESLELMLIDYGITEAEVEKYDEKKPSFWTSFFPERNRYLHFLTGYSFLPFFQGWFIKVYGAYRSFCPAGA